MTLGVDGHGHQGDGDLFAGGQELVHFALGRDLVAPAEGADFPGQLDEVVGGVAHGADDDGDLISLLLGGDGAAGGTMNFFRIGDTAPPELLHD